eukprot:5757875-Alexandrium_andersonii.AAC.1
MSASLVGSEMCIRDRLNEKLGVQTANTVLEGFVDSTGEALEGDSKLKRAMQMPWLLGYVGDSFFSYGIGEKPAARLVAQ